MLKCFASKKKKRSSQGAAVTYDDVVVHSYKAYFETGLIKRAANMSEITQHPEVQF